jgi:hypothetical protein
MTNEADAVRAVDDSSMAHPANDAWDPYDVWLKRVKRPRDEAPTSPVPTLVLNPMTTHRTHRSVRRRAGVPT